MLALALIIYFAASVLVVLPDPSAPLTSQKLINSVGYAAIGLLVLLCLQYRKQGLRQVILGQRWRRPLLFGLIATRSERIVGDEVIKNYVPVFTVAAGIYIAAGLMWMLIDSTRSLDDVITEDRPDNSSPS